ncbi:major capsid family protein [Curvibacter lanceolatus]|uniref:major capsid family protein n=1 Tax=Curvibacter lanceolatus TaxID=86182 RepID=UPI00036421A8|nr:major capsid family protein [Curvibacter lanceolatus]
MNKSQELSYVGPRNVGPVAMDAEDVAEYQALSDIGIQFPTAKINAMAAAMDATNQGLITTAGNTTPIQFLQAWMPGFVRVITAARKIDELIGITTVGSWEDEEVVQGVLEPIGQALPYGDTTNVPLASWNTNFERRTVVRFEKGFQVGVLEEERAARIRANSAAEKRSACALALEVQRNAIGFYGFNSGNNRTYGFLNDPALPAYYTVPNGAAGSPTWANKQFLEITADIRTAVATLQTQSQDTINPETTPLTLAVPTAAYAYLSVTSNYGNSVREWIKETFPKMRVVSAPQLNAANGGANVFYLFAESVDDGASDDSRVFNQVVPAKFRALGVEKRAKAYVEDYTNATAGVMCKRPYAVVRASGI